MKRQAISCALFVAALFTVHMVSAQPASLLPPIGTNLVPAEAKGKQDPKKAGTDKDKKLPEKKQPDPPKSDFFAPITSPVGDFAMFNPNMMGDKNLWYARVRLAIAGTQTVSAVSNVLGTTAVVGAVTQTRNVLVPIPQRGGSNIAENSSPMPIDRVFATYNYYNRLGFGTTGQNAPITTTTTTGPIIIRGGNAPVTTTTTTVIPGAQRVDLHREIFGFEKTFLDGYASIEVRAPIDQMGGADSGFGYNSFGDITVVGKYALYLDRTTGNVFSTGLAVTAPTGRSIDSTDGRIHDVLLQPFIGYIWNFERWYIQGFHSVVVPTDVRDVTLAYNDVGINYWLYRGGPDRFVRFIVPSVEAHVTTPLNHRALDGPIVVPDTVVLTSGVHFGLGRNATLTFGAGVPVTGPRPFNVEGFVQFNFRY